jgi:DNA-binding SARP family transcriptional activator
MAEHPEFEAPNDPPSEPDEGLRTDSFLLIDATGHVQRDPYRVVGSGRAGSSVHCWEVLEGLLGGELRPSCAHCAIGTAMRGGDPDLLATTEPVTPHCTVIPQGNSASGALVWMRSPFEDPAGPDAAVARMLLQGGLAQALSHRDVGLALEVLRGVLGAENAELFVAEPSGDLVMFECRGLDAELLQQRRRFAAGTGIPGWVVANRQPLATNDLEHDPRYVRDAGQARGLRACACVPLPVESGVAGSLQVFWRSPDAPLDRGVELLEIAAAPLADLVAASRRRVAGTAPVRARTKLGPGAAVPGATVDSPALEIRCLGPLEIRREGKRVPTDEFGRRRALTLLGLLALSPGHRVPRDAIIDNLWPGVDRAAGANRLYGLVHTLRRAVDSEGSRASWIRCRGGTYWLEARPALDVDLHRFFALLDRASEVGAGPAGDRSAAERLEEAIALYRGQLFEGEPDAQWLRRERAHVRDAFVDALRKLAALRLRLGQPEWSVEPLRRALEHNPLREDLQRALVEVLADLGRTTEATAQLASAIELLRAHGIRPASETLELCARLGVEV